MPGAPLIYRWDGESMTPLGRFVAIADREFVAGENYQLEIVQPRSTESHNHYFARIAEVWTQMRENVAAEHGWLTADDMRKWALVECGFHTEYRHKCATMAEAVRAARMAVAMAGEEYVKVVVDGTDICIRRAKSQSTRAMKRAEFQASKMAVLDKLAELIGVSADELDRNAGRAA